MKKMYILNNNLDLTFDNVILPENEKPSPVPENLCPTDAMQDNFMQNCVDLGILSII